MTQQEIREIYKKQRHAFAQRKYYYKKKYGVELQTPKTVKNPTEKTLESFARQVYKQTEKVKRKTSKKTKRNIPSREEILLNRINENIREGLRSDNPFENYKANKVNDLLHENLPINKQERIKKLNEWEKALPELDKAIDTFIFDSSQTDTQTKNHTTNLWDTFTRIFLGVKTAFIEEYDIDDEL